MTTENNEGLPEDPAERRAELDRLVAAGEAEMGQNIDAWQKDKQRRADHLELLRAREEEDPGNSELSFYQTAPIDDVRAVLDKLEPAIREMESLMQRNIVGYGAKENAGARAVYRRALEVHQSITNRLKGHGHAG